MFFVFSLVTWQRNGFLNCCFNRLQIRTLYYSDLLCVNVIDNLNMQCRIDTEDNKDIMCNTAILLNGLRQTQSIW